MKKGIAAALGLVCVVLSSCGGKRSTRYGVSLQDAGLGDASANSAQPTDDGDGGLTNSPPFVLVDSGADADADPDPYTGPSPFGEPCSTDADCLEGFSCLTEDGDAWLGGGAAQGYCTLPCDDAPLKCTDYDPAALCLRPLGASYAFCFRGCVLGQTDIEKCLGRGDQACVAINFLSGACLPTCGYDAQCPEGRYCDIGHGVCVDEPPSGVIPGAACYSDDECVGRCAGVGDRPGVCNATCVLGEPGGCGVEPERDPLPGEAVCATFSGWDGAGDLGLCVQTCTCDADCSHPDAFCAPAPEGSFTSERLCLYDGYADAGAPRYACPDAQDASMLDAAVTDAAIPNASASDAATTDAN